MTTRSDLRTPSGRAAVRVGTDGGRHPVDVAAVESAPVVSWPNARSVFCPRFHHAVELVGRRWTGVVLRAMLAGATRYSDIRAAVPDLSDKMLAERLKELESEGVLTRTVIPSTPVRVEYRLTDKGRALTDALAGLAAWAAEWMDGPPEPSHDV